MIEEHKKYIRRCFELAKTAIGFVSPNPLVGCLIVKSGQVIAEGFHKGSGKNHAEIEAIKKAKTSVRGATLYCNLEPCCHTNKKTPPCAQRLINEGIKQVVISNLDPNPQVAGKGVQLLRDAGIDVVVNILKETGEELNEVFFYHIVHKKPFIHLKMAQTLDGKMATILGDSKWITNEESRNNVHLERNSYDAILVGGQTLRSDNPKLTIRLNGKERSSKRLILSPSGNVDLSFNVFTDKFSSSTFLISAKKSSFPNTISFDKDLNRLLQKLYSEHNICSIYVEGGAMTISWFLKQKIYNRLSLYIAPKILGQGKSIFNEVLLNQMSDSLEFKNIKWHSFGSDQMLSARIN